MFRHTVTQFAKRAIIEPIKTPIATRARIYIQLQPQPRTFTTTRLFAMKEVFLTVKDDTLHPDIRDVEIPTPKDDEVLIKVNVAGTNPKDWKRVFASPDKPLNSGDDIAGTVAAVGSKVVGYEKGQRVAAFHVMMAKHGAFAEYAISPASTVFHIPPNISDEEAATIPLTVLTAGVGIHSRLGLPTPWHPLPKGETLPLLVNGGSSANGLFALKLARLSGITPIIAIAGGGADIIREGNWADIIIDYRSEPDLTAAITKALGGLELKHAYDAIGENGSPAAISKAMTSGGLISCTIEVDEKDLSNGVKHDRTYVGSVHHDYKGMIPQAVVDTDREYGYVLSKYVTRVLENGKLTPHPHSIVEGGLDGLTGALMALKQKKISGKKLVIRITDTKGLGKSQL